MSNGDGEFASLAQPYPGVDPSNSASMSSVQAAAPDNLTNSTLAWSQEMLQAFYRQYNIVTLYRYVSGTEAFPVAGPPLPTAGGVGASGQTVPQQAIVQLSSPHMQKLVIWHAKRVGVPPTHPDPFALPGIDSNHVLKGYDIWEKSPNPEDGANFFFEAGGYYLYDLLRPLTPVDGQYRLGAPPVTTLQPGQSVLPQSSFSQNVL